jgi:hypothetical protein
VGVVDRLEAVEVEEHERGLQVVLAGAGDGPVEDLAQQGAVGQPGQRVVEGQVLGLLLGDAALGDVVLDADVLDDRPRVVEDGRQEHLVPERAAVLAAVEQRDARLVPAAQGGRQLGDRGRIGRVGLQQAARAPHDVVQRVAGDALEAGVRPRDREAGLRRVAMTTPLTAAASARSRSRSVWCARQSPTYWATCAATTCSHSSASGSTGRSAAVKNSTTPMKASPAPSGRATALRRPARRARWVDAIRGSQTRSGSHTGAPVAQT